MTYKKFIILFILLFMPLPSLAEKIPVKITPVQIISTHHDEVEVGDLIKFEIVNDVYLNNKLYIKKYTEILGLVDFVHCNGWGGDSAEIIFKTFYTKDVNGQKVIITYPLEFIGNREMANSARQVPVGTFEYLSYFFNIFRHCPKNVIFLLRGAEIFIEPDTVSFNIFIER